MVFWRHQWWWRGLHRKAVITLLREGHHSTLPGAPGNDSAVAGPWQSNGATVHLKDRQVNSPPGSTGWAEPWNRPGDWQASSESQQGQKNQQSHLGILHELESPNSRKQTLSVAASIPQPGRSRGGWRKEARGLHRQSTKLAGPGGRTAAHRTHVAEFCFGHLDGVGNPRSRSQLG